MNFDWTTFLLEILNFFILLWLLQRFLYRPVLEVIQTRQRNIQATLEDARRLEAEALATRGTLDARIGDWEAEKARAQARLEEEIAAERQRLLKALEEDLAEAKARQTAHDDHERREVLQAMERQALDSGGRFVSRLLQRLGSTQLEDALVAAALDDLERLPAADIEKLKAALAANGLEVVSVFPLSDGRRQALEARLGQLAGQPVHPVYRQEPALLSGLCIHVGSWVLAANLRDELKFFRETGSADAG
jgi:F-type H+-transporting ATPase subunit b